jgi:hypothetical protein
MYERFDLLNHALAHRDCPENLTVQWLTQFVGQVGNEIDIHKNFGEDEIRKAKPT